MKAKKLLTNMLCFSIVASNITPVFATVTNDTLIFEDTDTGTSKQTEVLYEKAGSYFVTIPKTISLGADKQSPYSVKVEGDIPSDKQVYVSPIDGIKDTEVFDFYMHDQSAVNPKADVVATVTQNKFYWNFSEVADGYAETNNQVTAEELTSGTWKGTFDFEINMHKVEPEFTLTTDGDVTLPVGESHQLNAYIDGIESNSDVEWSCDNSEVAINNGYIEIPDTVEVGTKIRITVFKNGKETSFTIVIEEDKQSFGPGLYDANGTMLVNWEDSGIDETCSNAKDVINNNYPTTTKVVMSNSVTSIGEKAFYDCTSLTNIEFSNYITSINNNAFQNCTSLTCVKIPNSVTSIGNSVFYNCTSLTNVEMSNLVTSIGDCAFSYCTSLTDMEIPNSVTSIGSYAFYNCTSLVCVEIPYLVTSINMSTFEGCTSLTDVEISNSVTRIADFAFYGCVLLNNIAIPNSVTRIDRAAFSGCTSLTDIQIPNSVTSIGGMAFQNVKHITYHGTASGSPWGAKSIN